jgi:hypothetical protein
MIVVWGRRDRLDAFSGVMDCVMRSKGKRRNAPGWSVRRWRGTYRSWRIRRMRHLGHIALRPLRRSAANRLVRAQTQRAHGIVVYEADGARSVSCGSGAAVTGGAAGRGAWARSRVR